MTSFLPAAKRLEWPVACVVGVGSNVGDRRAIVDEAVVRLRELAVGGELRVAPWIETAPIGGPSGQETFLNGAVAFDTLFSPWDTLAALHRMEAAAGRKREERWGARTLDLDLLLFGQWVVDTPALMLPHPRLAVRRFALEPAFALAPLARHPRIGWKLGTLLAHLRASGAPAVLLAPSAYQATASKIMSTLRNEKAEFETRFWEGDALSPIVPRLSFVLAPRGADFADWRAAAKRAEYAGALGPTLWLDGGAAIEATIAEVQAALVASR